MYLNLRHTPRYVAAQSNESYDNQLSTLRVQSIDSPGSPLRRRSAPRRTFDPAILVSPPGGAEAKETKRVQPRRETTADRTGDLSPAPPRLAFDILSIGTNRKGFTGRP